MINQSGILSKSLVVGVIVLFIGISVQPCIAMVQKEVMKTPTINPDDTWYLANLSMDFGEYITNNRIEYEHISERPQGNYTINVKINFECPDNLKIVVRYEYFAEVEDYEVLYPITFCNVKDTVTIINGSNPPDIDIDYTEYCPLHSGLYGIHLWLLTLRIKANLTAYEYLDGEWVKTHNDDIYNETTDYIYFNRIRTSERTKTSDNDDCNLCPKVSKKQSIRIESLFNRLRRYSDTLLLSSKLNPIVRGKYKELSDNIATLRGINERYMSVLKWVIEININLDWLLELGACIGWKFFRIPLRIIASLIKNSYLGELLGEFLNDLDELYGTECWKFIPFPLRSIIHINIYEI